jgi:hypothetical protein
VFHSKKSRQASRLGRYHKIAERIPYVAFLIQNMLRTFASRSVSNDISLSLYLSLFNSRGIALPVSYWIERPEINQHSRYVLLYVSPTNRTTCSWAHLEKQPLKNFLNFYWNKSDSISIFKANKLLLLSTRIGVGIFRVSLDGELS